MAQLRIFVLSSVFSFVSFASLAATGIFREQLIPGPPGGVTWLAMINVSDLVFTEFDANRIGMLTRDGQFQEFVVPTPDSGPRGITSAGSPASDLVHGIQGREDRQADSRRNLHGVCHPLAS